MINSISQFSTAQTTMGISTKAILVTKRISDALQSQESTASQSSDTVTISSLSKLLSASANRAEQDKTLTYSELANKAKRILESVVGSSYDASQSIHNSEVPNTNDSELLGLAKKATAFAMGVGRNPFAGLSHKQLNNIVYDDSGAYTVNERHAAWQESYDQEETWNQKICAQGMNEYNSTGKMTKFFGNALSHFQELSPIEQAQYPANYASDLQSKIDLDFNYRTGQADGKKKEPPTLIELLLMLKPDQRKSKDTETQKAVERDESQQEVTKKSQDTAESSTATMEYA